MIALLFLVGTVLSFNNAQAAYSNLSYADTQKHLRRLAADYPENASVFKLGTSDSGEPIEGLKIGNGPTNNLVVATHHGNEYGSTEVAKAVAESFAKNPLTDQTIWVIPVLNVSGYNAKNRKEKGNDPNRDYPGPCGTSGPFKLKSTASLARFIDEKNIINSTTLHTFASLILYPWGLSTRDLETPYNDFFIELGHLAGAYNKYEIANSTEALYAADGTFEDYAFWKHGIWSLLFEMGKSHSPSDRKIEEMIEGNVPAIRNLFAKSPKERAQNHAFTGKCDTRLQGLRTHLE